MRRIATAALLAFAIAGMAAAQPARAQQLLFDYVGFDYEDPILPASTFGDLGNGYVGIGEVPFIDPLLTTNPTLNEYTYHLSGLISTNKQVFGNIVVIDYAGPGTLKLYEDLKSGGTAFDYGTNPPNGTAPSTFADGTSIIEFSVTSFRIILNTTTGSGSYDSQLTVTGGSQFGNIPVNQQSGWQFAGVTGNSVTIPQGYVHQVDGQTFLVNPTHSRTSSWGQLKRGYR
jgi:hypothetical protein